MIVLLGQNKQIKGKIKMFENFNILTDMVIELHQIARILEENLGVGEISDDLRKIADKLSELLKKEYKCQ
jgi:hypothetical protein